MFEAISYICRHRCATSVRFSHIGTRKLRAIAMLPEAVAAASIKPWSLPRFCLLVGSPWRTHPWQQLLASGRILRKPEEGEMRVGLCVCVCACFNINLALPVCMPMCIGVGLGI